MTLSFSVRRAVYRDLPSDRRTARRQDPSARSLAGDKAGEKLTMPHEPGAPTHQANTAPPYPRVVRVASHDRGHRL